MAKSKPKNIKGKLSLFQKISLYFFNRPRRTALLWLLVAVFGAASYSVFLKREGFPSVETPFALSQGAYLVNDASKVDQEVARPLSDFILKQSGVDTVQTQSFDNFYVATVGYKEGVDAEKRSADIQKSIEEQNILPDQATGKLEPFRFGFTERGDDLVVSFYSVNNSVPTSQLAQKADQAAAYIKSKNLPAVEYVSMINPFETGTDPSTGASGATQRNFDRIGIREGDKTNFYNSIVIGVSAKDNVDQIELDRQVRQAVTELNVQAEFEGFRGEVSASNAPQINNQISELQRTLLEGLLAVLVVGSIIIAWRASVITVISMVTVIAAVNGLLYAIGYTLNTITLFALILGLALIVDDTIIMIEALDAQRRKLKKPDEIVKVATGKVGRAMIAATTTAALSFAPLLFVTGILGKFIRAIPVTIISALVVSLLVALVFIPLFARFILLRKKHMGKGNVKEPAAKLEASIARFLSIPMLWARKSKVKLFTVGLAALFIGFGFIAAGGYLFREVRFSIFPVDKDSNMLTVNITYAPGTSLDQAESVASKVHSTLDSTLGDNFVQASYFAQANNQKATLMVDLTDYKERAVKAPEIVSKLNEKFNNFEGASVKAAQVGAGPPPAIFAARIDSSQNRQAAIRLATDITKFLETTELTRPDGTKARIENVIPPDPNAFKRDDGKQYVEAGADFADTDTSALVTLAQQAVEKEFDQERVASYGLSKDALYFDFGQENENQESFLTLAIAFPVLLLAIYFLLALQFKSLVQPLLIFMAIPFSLFGITLGLYLTDNPFSFFAMLGFFALIGLSIKNTILLTDYANQARAAGMGPIDAAREALAERFRPLIATSFTAVFSLIPLALTSPFWEGLAVVLIFGLLSSTFLVVTVFPYYYLGAEYLRQRFSRKIIIMWLLASAASIYLLYLSDFGLYVLLVPIVTGLILYVFKKRQII